MKSHKRAIRRRLSSNVYLRRLNRLYSLCGENFFHFDKEFLRSNKTEFCFRHLKHSEPEWNKRIQDAKVAKKMPIETE